MALSHSNADVAAELGKLKWLRREGMTWQSAARLLGVLEKILPIELPPNVSLMTLLKFLLITCLFLESLAPNSLNNPDRHLAMTGKETSEHFSTGIMGVGLSRLPMILSFFLGGNVSSS